MHRLRQWCLLKINRIRATIVSILKKSLSIALESKWTHCIVLSLPFCYVLWKTTHVHVIKSHGIAAYLLKRNKEIVQALCPNAQRWTGCKVNVYIMKRRNGMAIGFIPGTILPDGCNTYTEIRCDTKYCEMMSLTNVPKYLALIQIGSRCYLWWALVMVLFSFCRQQNTSLPVTSL